LWTRRKFIEASCTGVGAALAAMAQETVSSTRPHAARSAPPSGQSAVSSARDVLARQLGERAAEFDLTWISPEDGREVYEIEVTDGRIKATGSSGVAICRAVYSYLRDFCNVMITWSGRHLDLPSRWPALAHLRVVCPYKFVQYLNPCTYGYTMAFWNWARWERELDWMALHGINMPFAMEGQEAIWQRVWLSLGLTQAEVDQFSTGPAHLPWHRMGNVTTSTVRCPSTGSMKNASSRAESSTVCEIWE
jgi:alpha-N-acetylglucosaminidase